MKISVPKYEDPLFNQEVVRIINGLIDWMIEDYEERPQRVTFSGPLGKYLYDMCIRDDWDLVVSADPFHCFGATNERL